MKLLKTKLRLLLAAASLLFSIFWLAEAIHGKRLAPLFSVLIYFVIGVYLYRRQQAIDRNEE